MKVGRKIEYNNAVYDLKEYQNFSKPMIVATVGLEFFESNTEFLMERLKKYDINFIRVNLAKFETESSITDLKNKLINIQEKVSGAIKIMLDLPMPYKKIRFYVFNNENYIDVKKGEKLRIATSSNLLDEKTLCLIDAKNAIFKNVHIGDIVKYGDGECGLTILVVEKDHIIVEVRNDARLFAKKALNFNNSILNSRKEIANNKYTNLLKEIKPWAVAFSFISTKQDILDMKEYLININVETEVISKIETIDGIKNISEIMDVSSIMLARGDLSLNVPMGYFYDVQKYVFDKAVNEGKKIFIATGILSSLSFSNMPTQAEITDLSFILRYKPQGIILNYGVVRSAGFEKALELINLFDYYDKK